MSIMLKLYMPFVICSALAIESGITSIAVRANSVCDLASIRIISFCSFTGNSYHKQFE